MPSAFGKRRVAVLDIGEDRMKDIAYFAAIDAEMDSSGREALLQFLESYDLGAVDLRAIPKTGALLDQKIASLPAERGWWLDVLVSGQLPQGCERAGDCPAPPLDGRTSLRKHATGRHKRAPVGGDIAIEQPIPVLAEYGRIPHRIIHRQTDEPAEQQIVVELLHQLSFRAHREERLQQQRPQQTLRWNRRPTITCVKLAEVARQVPQRPVDQVTDRAQRWSAACAAPSVCS